MPSRLSSLVTLVALLLPIAALASPPLINQIGRLPARINGVVEMKFAIIEVERNPTRANAKASIARGTVSGLQVLQAGEGYEAEPTVNLVSESGQERAPLRRWRTAASLG